MDEENADFNRIVLPHVVDLSTVGNMNRVNMVNYIYIETQRETHSTSGGGGGGQRHLIRLTILRRFSWPSLAYNYAHKGGLKPHSFNFILHQSPRPITTRNIIQPNS